MKRIFNCGLLSFFVIIIVSCQDKNINIFDKSADERSTSAISDLKQKLIAPENGWKLKYQPDSASGYYYILLKFDDNNNVRIQTDYNGKDGKFYDQTITYRIDNSLGVELILESYCFFSYLFEQNEASYPAEYEFIFTNTTSDNALVFKSKTDLQNPTILLFEEAKTTDESLLGKTISRNLTLLSTDLKMFSSSLALTYTNKDLVLYASLDDFQRTIHFSIASKKSYSFATKVLDFTAEYIIAGDSLIFDTSLKADILGNSIVIKGLKLNNLSDDVINACADPIQVHSYSGVTSQGDQFNLTTSLLNISGKSFAGFDFLSGPIHNIFNNGTSAESDILTDFPNAVAIQLYYNFKLGNGNTLNGFGFVIQNTDGTLTFALWEFVPTLINNNLVLAFNSNVTLFGSPTDEDIANVKKYIGPIAQGGKTYVFKLNETAFEFYNPCTEWGAVLFTNN